MTIFFMIKTFDNEFFFTEFLTSQNLLLKEIIQTAH